MKKKQVVSIMDFEPFQFNDTPQAELPTIEAVEESVSKVTNKPKKPKAEKVEKVVEKPKAVDVTQKVQIIQSERWFKPEAVGREKLTTYINAELILELKMKVLKMKGVSLADLIERILKENYEKY